jgi:hypothetical protein
MAGVITGALASYCLRYVKMDGNDNVFNKLTYMSVSMA